MMQRILLTGMCLALTMSQPAAQQPDSGSIQGSVVNSQTGEPVKKAQVTFTDQGGVSQPLLAITDSSGNFHLTHVPPGSYRADVVRTGFVRAQSRHEEASREPDVLAVAPKQEITGLVYRLAPASVLAGRVMDEDGSPFAGVRLQCLRYSYSRGSRQLLSVGYATTDDRGLYRIAGLHSGHYYVRAAYTDATSTLGAVPGGGVEGYPSLYYPGVVDAGQAAGIPLREGEEKSGIDFKLAPMRAVHIQGIVRNLDGRTTGRDVVVSLTPRMSAGLAGRPPAPVGEDGGFRFDGVIPGSYLIMASSSAGSGNIVRQPLEVGESNLDGIRLILKPRVDLKGRVRIEGERKVPLDGLRLFLSPRDDLVLMQGGTIVASPGADGSFVFQGVSDGDYTVQIDNLPENCYLRMVLTRDRLAADREIHVDETLAGSALDLLVSAAGGRVEGTVTDEQQRPASSLTVVLVPDAARRSRGDLFRWVTSDQYGHFIFRGVSPGDYKLFVWPEDLESGSWRDSAVLASLENRGKTITVEESSRVSVDLRMIPTSQ
jgi:protocatechuate 3,4-dioxygenase beta subunit